MIHATPNPSFSTEEIHIIAEGLPSNKELTLHASLVNGKYKYESLGHYVSDSKGELDLKTAVSSGGMYLGVEPMGFLWAMISSPKNKYPTTRYAIGDISMLRDVIIHIYQGHVKDLLTLNKNNPMSICSKVIQRKYMPDNVTRIEVNNTIRGVLFVPHGMNQLPGILYISGGFFGTSEAHAAALAREGFVVFALIYLDKGFDRVDFIKIDLDYIELALKYLSSHPKVDGKCGIGISSISMGTQVGLAAISYLTGVNCFVGVNGELTCKNRVFYNKGNRVLPAKMRPSAKIIPLYKNKRTKILFAASLSDKLTDIAKHIDILESMIRNYKMDNIEILKYKKANHVIDLPYTLMRKQVWFPTVKMVKEFGGEPKAHMECQLNFWKKEVEFFKQQLGCQTSTLCKL